MPPKPICREGDVLNPPVESVFAFLWRVSGGHQISMAALGVLTALLVVAPIDIHRRLVDDVIVSGNLDLLIKLGLIYLGIIVAKISVKHAFQLYQGWVIESTALRLRETLASRQTESKQPAENSDAGAAVTVIGAETDKVSGFVGEALSQIVMNLTMLFAVSIYMLAEQWLIGLVALVILLPQAVVVPYLQDKINELIKARVEGLRCLGEDITDLAERSARSDDRRIGARILDIYNNRLRIYFWKFLSKNFVNLMNTLAPAVLLVFGGYMVIKGETSLGVLVAFLSGLERIQNPLRDLVSLYREIAQARIQYRKIIDWAA